MFIIKFNKLIHNKWVWGAFAFVVAIAFAGSDLISSRGHSVGRDGIGMLDGRPVSFREYDLVRQQVRMEFMDHPMDDIDWDEEIWQRLAAIRAAERMGITVSDEEIVEMLRNDPSFLGPDGRFDPVRYRGILEHMVGITPEVYQEVLRNQMLIGKVERSIASASWGVPSVAKEQGRRVTDRFTVRVVEITNTLSAAEIDLSGQELEEFFQDNLATYRIPESVAVRYVTFPVSRFKDQVTVDGEDARDFYDAHLERYQVVDKGQTTTLSFEDVRKIVESELRIQQARERAASAAADFSDLFYLGIGVESSGDFERLALEQGLHVNTTALFAADAVLPEIDRKALFAQNAFDLDAGSLRDQFSDAVVGGDASYVLAFHDRQEARDPDLSEVLDTVRADAAEFHRARLFRERVESMRSAVVAATARGNPLDEALREFELQAGTNTVLTAVDAFQSLPGGHSLATRMLRMGEGEISSSVFLPESAVWVTILDRKPGEPFQLQVMSSQMAMQLRSGIAEQVSADWRHHTLASMNLVTARRSEVVETDAYADGREP